MVQQVKDSVLLLLWLGSLLWCRFSPCPRKLHMLLVWPKKKKKKKKKKKILLGLDKIDSFRLCSLFKKR